MSYIWEKFHKAVNVLTSSVPLAERLEYAGMEIVLLDADDFDDEELRERFIRIKEAYHEEPPAGDLGSIHMSVRARDAEEQRELAEDIVGMFSQVCEARGRRDT